MRKRRARKGFGLLGRWAAGGAGERETKSPEEELEDAMQNTIKIHRESVIWYLRTKLEEAAEIQRAMMQQRLEREVEKSKSALYKTKGPNSSMPLGPDFGNVNGNGNIAGGGYKGGKAALADDVDRKKIEQQLSPEQLQLFAQENSDMLKHYEDQLDQVRCV